MIRETAKAVKKPRARGLDTYNEMRDFTKTREPRGKTKTPNADPIFVVQEHHATRLHFDFRLEADGVLKSWAITNKPAMDPKVKRLAIEVEDHPLSYAGFEGSIPHGQYGGGTVAIWDSGTYRCLNDQTLASEIAAGKISIELRGKKLKGRFHLIRMKSGGKKPQWLFIKSKDDAKPKDNAPKLAVTSHGRPGKIEFSHLDKVMFPESGITKREVLAYYDKIAPYLLPYLRSRPVTLERLPDGVTEGGPHFWQKNIPDSYPAWIPRAHVAGARAGESVDYAMIQDKTTLLYLVNQGALTLHTGASRIEHFTHPDFVVFDLDRGGAAFKDVVKLARALRLILQKDPASERLDAFVKTSGKSGLHVLVPWRQDGDHDSARAWAMKIARTLVDQHPTIASVERSKAKRTGKVYIDVMQNALGHHVAPAYVLRAVPGASISTPLLWNEVTPRLNPRKFTIKTIFKRLKNQKRDPLAGLLAKHGQMGK